jgi:hypothetical protein
MGFRNLVTFIYMFASITMMKLSKANNNEDTEEFNVYKNITTIINFNNKHFICKLSFQNCLFQIKDDEINNNFNEICFPFNKAINCLTDKKTFISNETIHKGQHHDCSLKMIENHIKLYVIEMNNILHKCLINFPISNKNFILKISLVDIFLFLCFYSVLIKNLI